MKIGLLAGLLFLMSSTLFAQYKVVKIVSEDIYINYFYKINQTKRTKNDTTFYLIKKIAPSSFFLEKYINNKKVWRRRYRTKIVKDSLNVMERSRDSVGQLKINNNKKQYFLGEEVKNN